MVCTQRKQANWLQWWYTITFGGEVLISLYRILVPMCYGTREGDKCNEKCGTTGRRGRRAPRRPRRSECIVNPKAYFYPVGSTTSRVRLEARAMGSRGSTASAMPRLYHSAQSAPRPRPRTRAPRSDQPRSRGKSTAVPPIDRAASTRVEDLARDPTRGSSTRLRATAGNRRNRAEHT